MAKQEGNDTKTKRAQGKRHTDEKVQTRQKREEVAFEGWSQRGRLRWAGLGAVGPERLLGLTDGKLIIGAQKDSRKFFFRSKRN